jgi:hypothetical protein
MFLYSSQQHPPPLTPVEFFVTVTVRPAGLSSAASTPDKAASANINPVMITIVLSFTTILTLFVFLGCERFRFPCLCYPDRLFYRGSRLFRELFAEIRRT